MHYIFHYWKLSRHVTSGGSRGGRRRLYILYKRERERERERGRGVLVNTTSFRQMKFSRTGLPFQRIGIFAHLTVVHYFYFIFEKNYCLNKIYHIFIVIWHWASLKLIVIYCNGNPSIVCIDIWHFAFSIIRVRETRILNFITPTPSSHEFGVKTVNIDAIFIIKNLLLYSRA